MDPKDLMTDYNDILQTIANVFEDFKGYVMHREGHFVVLSNDKVSFLISVVSDTVEED